MKKDRCPCGGIILADTEDWSTPLCYSCFYELTIKTKDFQKLQKQNEKLKQRLEVSIYFQNKAKDFISHFEDCNALTDPDFYESDEACMCGLDAFAHNNHLAIEIGKETLKEIEGEK